MCIYRNQVRLLLLGALCTQGAVAQVPENTDSAAGKNFKAVFAKQSPVIDGGLNDEIWRSAPILADFHQVNPTEYAAPGESTEVRVLYDEDYLYIAANVGMTDISLTTANKKAQGQSADYDDKFFVVLDPFASKRSGYYFGVTPYGIRVDGIYEGAQRPNQDWSGVWDVKTKLGDAGWTAEMRIPFKTLNFNPENPNWGISFGRKNLYNNEDIAWTSYSRNTNPVNAGVMEGVRGVHQGQGLDISPSVTSRQHKDFSSSNNSGDLEPSVTAFYKFTPNLTGALTLNPDFSAAEVDELVVNLDRFSVFLPEKRKFFLQDADIFTFGGLEENGRPFFSRKIGIAANGTALTIDGGLKLTGRVGDVNLGVLGVQQEGFLDDNNSQLSVVRATANVFAESSVGFIATEGDPFSDNGNRLYGFDSRLQSSELLAGKTFSTDFWYQQSDSEQRQGDESAYGMNMQLFRSAGWWGNLAYRRFGEDFNPALGFVNRRGIKQLEGEIHFAWYRPDSYWRKLEPAFEYNYITGLDGQVESEYYQLQPSIESVTRDWYAINFNHSREVLREDFEIVDGVFIAAGDYRWNRVEAVVWSGEQRKLWTEFWVKAGDFYNGKRYDYEPALTWQPAPWFSSTLSYKHWDVHLPQERFITRVASFKTEVAFTNTLLWSTVAQYDNNSDVLGLNTRLRWMPTAGKEILFMINRGFSVEDNQNNPLQRERLVSMNSEIVLKATYLLRF